MRTTKAHTAENVEAEIWDTQCTLEDSTNRSRDASVPCTSAITIRKRRRSKAKSTHGTTFTLKLWALIVKVMSTTQLWGALTRPLEAAARIRRFGRV